MHSPHRLTGRLMALAAVGLGMACLPAAAQAHGAPGDPIASSYLARVQAAPPGLRAQVLGGDQRLLLQAPPGQTVVVIDYQGTPYLRFTGAGVEVNHNSAMFYLNLPTPVTPPAQLGPRVTPDWVRATTSHSYAWHDGRLHALASVALAPGQRYVGRWTIPVRVDGHPAAIAGSVYHADPPPLIWFWPIVVLVLCVLAAWRMRRPAIDRWLTRGLTGAVLVALAVGVAGRELYGRPTVTAGQLVVLGLGAAFVAWGALWLLRDRLGFFAVLLIGVAALGEATIFLSTLWNGYVFTVLPADLIRATTVVCLGGSLSLLLLSFRVGEPVAAEGKAAAVPRASTAALDDELAWDPYG